MIHLYHHDRDIEDPWLRARLAMLPAGARILDVGCVDGWVLDEYPAALGVDSREAPVKWVGRFDRCDAERIPHIAASFDAVTCVSVLEHVGLGWYGDPEGDEGKAGRVVAEMARVLRPGGWLFLTVPIDLTMTKDRRAFARKIQLWDVSEWLDAVGLFPEEWLDINTVEWDAAPCEVHDGRELLLVSAQKRVPA